MIKACPSAPFRRSRTWPEAATFALLLLAACNGARQPSGTAAPNPPQPIEDHLQSDFSGGRAQVSNRKSHAELNLAAYGCAGHAVAVGNGVRAESGARVEYRHAEAGVTEWYERDARGVEQGFTLERAGCDETDDVEVDVGVAGLKPHLAAHGDGVDLLDELGAVRMHYTDLSARDARGRALSATMSVKGERIALRVGVRGAAYPIVVDPELWSERGTSLSASDGAPSDRFGSSLAVSGDVLLVGASAKTVGGNPEQGAAYVFLHAGTTWTQQGTALVRTDGASNDTFGSSVSVSGDTAVVGAHNKTVGGNGNQGAVYVFVRSGTNWTQQGPPLARTDAAAGDLFGFSVSISGDTAAIGALKAPSPYVGAAYVFVRSGTTWTQQGPPLTATDPAANDEFGSVSVSGDTLLVGAGGKSVGGKVQQGVAYVFVRTGTVWAQQGPPLAATDAAAGDAFGSSVFLSGDTAIIGADSKTVGANGNQGAAYIFVRSGTTWTQQGPPLTAADGSPGDQFGYSVSLSGVAALVGAPWKTANGHASQGAAYVFLRSGTAWTQQGPALTSTDGAADDNFGVSLAIWGDVPVIASGSTVGTNQHQGAAHFFADSCTSDTDCRALAYCSNGVCTAYCAHDADCPTGTYCPPNGVCHAQTTQGATCNQTAGNQCMEAGCAVCSTGSCTDGVCCESACNGKCEACSAALTGGVDGSCLPIPADQDPQNECAADLGYPGSCQADGACDGSRACRKYAKSGTACGETACSSGSVAGKLCNGTGGCQQNTLPCAPYVCGASACTTTCKTDNDCDISGYCLNGTCATTKNLAGACKNNVECASGFCADGECCNAACNGQCEACGAKGKCAPVKGTPVGERKACDGDPKECGGSCDGADVAECKYASTKEVCGQSCDSVKGQASESTCDGKGACGKPMTSSCGAYACGDTACLLSCSTAADCADGYDCSSAECTPQISAASCSTDLSTSTPQKTMVAVQCAPYLCDSSAGTCLKDCTTIDDCSAGNVCDSSNHCVPSATPTSSSSGGCSVGRTSRPESPAAALAALLLGFATVRRRRRARSALRGRRERSGIDPLARGFPSGAGPSRSVGEQCSIVTLPRISG